MLRLVAIAAGGAVGAVLRFGLTNGVHALLNTKFPYGTLVVNVLGCLAMGFLSVVMLERFVSVEWRAALLTGLLGAFTTFSTFSLETLNLLNQGESTKALLNIFLSFSLCLLATWLGLSWARQL
ncbi:camphor resistance CrcB protein [Thioploca ingrica]|uniref:Fluoride-specific ion channel FluC n=1 Tax=Thioploca ingrica TaxID=40754 RepID=A0A090ANM4_9GAMM|nr:camphor resistance CrcB protein [Thioploca ingrica]BAP57732.1 camphor resistance CrcB protein [Thioploca ingrica]